VSAAAARPHNPLPVLAGAVLVVMASQQAIVPVLAPLARDLALPEWVLGLMMTASAGMFALTSSRWGRAIDRVGHRTVLISGLVLCLLGTVGFAIACELAVRGILDPGPAMALMIVTRALLFGTGMGAVPTAAMAWVAANTVTTADRVRGLSRIGAVQGSAMAIGPAAGAALAFAGFLGPVWLAPGAVAVTLLAAAWLLPRPPRRTPETVAAASSATTAGAAADSDLAVPAAPASRLRPWDPRLWPVMLAGFSCFLTLGIVIICLGFVVQDRLGLEGAATARTTGLISTVIGVFMLSMQAFVVPRLAWAPWRLLRTGIPLVGIGGALLTVADTLPLIMGCMAILAIGMGFAGPGYTSAPTLLVGPREQGHVAGLVQTVSGTTFVIGPLAGSALYGIASPLPFVVGATVCAAAAVFVWTRSAPDGGPVAEPADQVGAAR